MMGYAFQIFFLGGIELYMIAGIVGIISFGVTIWKGF